MPDTRNEAALGLGERLRSARKAKALTLEQAAFTLRLEASVLHALEDERYDALGAAVFVRGHLRAYARLLGLSEESVLAAYRAADPGADAPPKVAREREKPLTTTPGPLAMAAAVGFVVAAMILLYVLGAGEPPAPASPGAVSELPLPVDPAPVGDDLMAPPAGDAAPGGEVPGAVAPAATAAPPTAGEPVAGPAAATTSTPLPAEAAPAPAAPESPPATGTFE
jgi:cytoskeleton protein RodZ